MANASAHALEREQQARDAFLKAKSAFDADVLHALVPTDCKAKHMIQILHSNVHLASCTFGAFNHWSRSNILGGEPRDERQQQKECQEAQACNCGKR